MNSSQTKITAVVLTKDEATNLDTSLSSLQWCDEILVVDDYSSDETVTVAKKNNAKVFKHYLDNDFGKQRNYGLNLVKHEWVLFVDADEEISKKLINEISLLINSNPSASGYRVKRQDIFLGQKMSYGETANWNEIRLARKDSGKWVGKIHETWQINSEVGQLSNPLLHHSHKNMTEFLQKINWYSTLVASEFYEQGKLSSWWKIIVYPMAKFFQNYILRFGFLDGTHGFVHAACMSFHSFLVRGKLYLLNRPQKIVNE